MSEQDEVLHGSSNRTIVIDVDWNKCLHPDTDPLYCEAHNYEHEVGFVCADCHKQFFWSDAH